MLNNNSTVKYNIFIYLIRLISIFRENNKIAKGLIDNITIDKIKFYIRNSKNIFDFIY